MPRFAEVCIQRFRELNPGYRVNVHDESILIDQYSDAFHRTQNTCSKSDLLRLSVLRRFGGWYFDTDFFPLRPIDEILANYNVKNDFFVTRQTNRESAKAIANGIIGISANSPAWFSIDKQFLENARDTSLKRTTFGPLLMTKILNENPKIGTVGRQRDFYPFLFRQRSQARCHFRRHIRSAGYRSPELKGNPYCIHLWAGGKKNIHTPPMSAPVSTKSVMVVANYKGNYGDYCHAVNSADVVIRMNRCLGFGNEQGRMGFKTRILGLVSSGGGARQFTRPIKFIKPGGRVRDQLEQVWFVRPKGWSLGNKRDLSDQIIAAQELNGVNIVYPSSECWNELNSKLRKLQSSYVTPSTGMVVVEMLLDDPRFSDHTKYLLGFTHEGIRVHPFSAERRLMSSYVEQGLLHRFESQNYDVS